MNFSLWRASLRITGSLPVPSHFTATKLTGYLLQVLVFLDTGDLWVIPVRIWSVLRRSL